MKVRGGGVGGVEGVGKEELNDKILQLLHKQQHGIKQNEKH